MDRKILSALIGLAGAVSNNGKSSNTDGIIRGALLNDAVMDWVSLIHKEKFTVSPGCETCSSPCGNTSDYPVDAFESWSKARAELTDSITDELVRIASASEEKLPDIVYKAIAYIGYDLENEAYSELLEEMKKW